MINPWLNENATYEQIRNAARQRLVRDRQAGGALKTLADRLGPQLARHVTDSGLKGDPCQECGEQWPCQKVVFILTPK